MKALKLERLRPIPTGVSNFYFDFNRRFGRFLIFLTFLHPLIFIISYATQRISIEMAMIHFAIYVIALGFMAATRMRDAAMSFIVTHPFWLYSFSLFAYSVGYWKSPETDLYAPILSSIIVLVALIASITGYCLTQILCLVTRLPQNRTNLTSKDKQSTGIGLALIAAPLVTLPYAISRSSFFAAVGGMFEPMLWLGLLIYCAGKGERGFFSPLVLFIALVAFVNSIAFNGRALLFAFGLTAALAYLGVARRPVTFMRALMLYLTINAANAFSYAMLSARLIAGRADSASLALKTIFSYDFVLAILGFDTMSDNAAVVNNQLIRHDHYLLHMFDGRLGIPERLTELPHMDIVVAQLQNPVPIKWPEIANVLLSALPSFGQSKDIIFNDRLVWETGLMVNGNVGHPLVTAIGEFYAMGGLPVLFIFFALMMAVTLYFYEISKRTFADRFVAATALICFTLYMVMSSTSVSALSVPMRIYPMILILFYLFKVFRHLVQPRSRRYKLQIRDKVGTENDPTDSTTIAH